MAQTEKAVAGQLEIFIPPEQLNTGINQLQQNHVPPEQVAIFLGQQVVNHIVPVVVQTINTANVQQQPRRSCNIQAQAKVVIPGAVVVIAGAGAVGSYLIINGAIKLSGEHNHTDRSIQGVIIGVGVAAVGLGAVVGVVAVILCVLIKFC